ncbi:MAG: polysaccharide pyruvyl transferase family protein [Microbacterium sp.]|nr:polysaccharide pyruvyl transferase family protein [Microbacterium sp.]
MSTTADETRDRLDFVDAMAGDAVEALSRLHEGVRQVVFTDFPDHHNIGDAAIALGQLAFWRRAGIEVVMTYSWRTIGDGVFGSAIPVAIQGGGNVGGLYPVHGEHRFALAERLDPATLLIQEPQTIHFVTDADRESFATRLASREAFRLAVRDRPSLDAVRDLMPSAILSPDSAHVLGRLAAHLPVRVCRDVRNFPAPDSNFPGARTGPGLAADRAVQPARLAGLGLGLEMAGRGGSGHLWPDAASQGF